MNCVLRVMAPEPDEDDGETWVLFNAMNGNRAEM
ncbi:antirestriction protein, partial [Escherichia coli]|nr:antirestriction protein [Escherichia coli]